MAFVLGEIIAVLKMGMPFVLLAFPIMVIIKIITKKQVSVFVVIFLFIFLGFSVSSYAIAQRDMVWQLEEKSVIVTGYVSKIENNDYGQYVFLENALMKGRECGRVLVSFERPTNLKIGNIIEVGGRIQHFDKAHNEGNFDVRNYYMSLGIFTKIVAKQYQIKRNHFDRLRNSLSLLRTRIAENFFVLCNERGIAYDLCKGKAGILSAITLGDKSELDVEIKELYSAVGIAHILAISGLHIQIIGMFIYGKFRKKFSFGMAAFFSILFVTAFGIISGFGIATVRAFVMFVLRLIGEVFGRTYDSLTAMSFAAIILLMKNPFIIVNSGFQMSFIAIIAIVIVQPCICFVMHIKSKILQRMLFSVTIGLLMNPIIAYYYFQLPTYSFVLNAVVIPLMSIVFVSAIGGSIVSFLGGGIGKIFLIPACAVLEVYHKLCTFVVTLPYANVVVGKPSVTKIVLYYCIFSITLSIMVILRKKVEQKNTDKEKIINKNGKIIVSRSTLLKKEKRRDYKFRIIYFLFYEILSLILYVSIQKGFEIKFMDVGQGDGIFVRSDSGVTLMIDGGSTTVSEVAEYRMISCIKCGGEDTIDYAIVTHMDQDHISGLEKILQKSDANGMKIKNLILPDIPMKDMVYKKIEKLGEIHGAEVLYITKGDRLQFGETEIECIHPGKEYISDDRNDYSTVLRLKYKNFSVLLTGDIPSEQEKEIVENLNDTFTVLKAAHHGSNGSSCLEFLSKVKPMYTVISVGENNQYGHPGKDTLERLRQIGTNIMRTDFYGGIIFRTDGKNVEIDTMN